MRFSSGKPMDVAPHPQTTEEIVAACEDWLAGRRFGEVQAYAGDRIPAPAFLARPVPRG